MPARSGNPASIFQIVLLITCAVVFMLLRSACNTGGDPTTIVLPDFEELFADLWEEDYSVYDEGDFNEKVQEFDWEEFVPSEWGFSIAPGSYTGMYEVYMRGDSLRWRYFNPHDENDYHIYMPHPDRSEELAAAIREIDRLTKMFLIEIAKEGFTAEGHAVFGQLDEIISALLKHPKLNELMVEQMDEDGYSEVADKFSQTLVTITLIRESLDPRNNPSLN